MKKIVKLSLLILGFSALNTNLSAEDFSIPAGSATGGTGSTGPGAPSKVPIDMNTTSLLVAGMGIIASYAFFARRRKENA